MIAGVKRQDLTLETVLDRISEYDIFRHYLGHDFKLGEPFSSPFHTDRDPSFSVIRTAGGRLHFTDFSAGDCKGKVIDFVRRFYPGRDYNGILQCINQDLNLGIRHRTPLTDSPILKGETGGRPISNHERSLIQVIDRRFNKDELSWWGNYHLDKEDLKQEPEVYAIKRLFVNKKEVTIPATELVFGYLFEGRYWKIYRPLARTRKEKWICNVPHDLMYGMGDLIPGKPVLLAKAVKDFKVFRKVTGNVGGFQYEGINVISEANLRFLKINFPWVLFNADPDAAGMKAMDHYVSNHGFSPLIVPPEYRCPVIKDFADLALHKGLDVVKDFINQIFSMYEILSH